MLLWGVRMKFSVSIETQSQDEKSFMIQRFQTGKNKIFDRAYRHLACTGLYHLCIAWLTHVFQNSLCDNTVGEKAERSCDNTVPHTSNIMPRVFYLHNAMILWNRSRDMLFFHKFTNRWIILVFHSFPKTHSPYSSLLQNKRRNKHPRDSFFYSNAKQNVRVLFRLPSPPCARCKILHILPSKRGLSPIREVWFLIQDELVFFFFSFFRVSQFSLLSILGRYALC